MGLSRPPVPPPGSPRQDTILKLAARPGGFYNADMEGDANAINGICGRLRNKGLLFSKHCGPRVTRHFTTQAAADAFVYVPTTPKRKAVVYREGWEKSAPAHYPVDAKGRPLYKITVAKKPPAMVYRTNTFSTYG